MLKFCAIFFRSKMIHKYKIISSFFYPRSNTKLLISKSKGRFSTYKKVNTKATQKKVLTYEKNQPKKMEHQKAIKKIRTCYTLEKNVHIRRDVSWSFTKNLWNFFLDFCRWKCFLLCSYIYLYIRKHSFWLSFYHRCCLFVRLHESWKTDELDT